MKLNEFFAKHELGMVEIHYSVLNGRFSAIRNSFKRLIKDNLYGVGDTPEAALADLIAKVEAGAPTRQKSASVVQQELDADDLDDLLG